MSDFIRAHRGEFVLAWLTIMVPSIIHDLLSRIGVVIIRIKQRLPKPPLRARGRFRPRASPVKRGQGQTYQAMEIVQNASDDSEVVAGLQTHAIAHVQTGGFVRVETEPAH